MAHIEKRPAKRIKMLSDDGLSEETSDTGEAQEQPKAKFRINESYARRFEHSKKRDELRKLEEKYKRADHSARFPHPNGSAPVDGGAQDDMLSGSELTSESEDDEAELATQELDHEIKATLQAIKSKDPLVYDKSSTFYDNVKDTAGTKNGEKGSEPRQHKDQPVSIQDYHRQNLMAVATDTLGSRPTSAEQDQDEAQRRVLIKEMHEVEPVDDGEGLGVNEEDFLVAKVKQKPRKPTDRRLEPMEAENDPETFLSNFMESRAWVPQDKAEYHPFESDDEEEDLKADEFEEAYNMRFEDPTRSNEKLLSHSRQAAAQHSVRRDEPTGRKRAREIERELKQTAKRERDAEKTRLRGLKVEQAAAKLKQFKKASGIRSKALPVEEWQKFLDEGWDSDDWDKEMTKHFNDHYYSTPADESHDAAGERGVKRKHLKKPRWEDNIDINDIVPDFIAKEDAPLGESDLDVTDIHENDNDNEVEDDEEEDGGIALIEAHPAHQDATIGDMQTKIRPTNAKDARQARADEKKGARIERRKLEEAVEHKMATDILPGSASKTSQRHFRYRDTSPSTFGLSTRDILMAEDSSLNQYAGLKKLASFRDREKKQKDKRKLSKSARLRKWRKETFGDENGPTQSLTDLLSGTLAPSVRIATTTSTGAKDVAPVSDGVKKSKKRSRTNKKKEKSIGI